jgi:Spy/CpxP family protein refolding chaperone
MVRTLTIIALIAVLGLGSAFFVGCRHPGHQRGAAFMMDYMAEALDLTEAQQAMANSYKDEILAKVKAKQWEKKKMHDELKVQLNSDAINTVRVKALVAEHRAGMDDVIDLVVDRVAEFHATLSPEQREKLVNKLEKFEKRHQSEWVN